MRVVWRASPAFATRADELTISLLPSSLVLLLPQTWRPRLLLLLPMLLSRSQTGCLRRRTRGKSQVRTLVPSCARVVVRPSTPIRRQTSHPPLSSLAVGEQVTQIDSTCIPCFLLNVCMLTSLNAAALRGR